MDADKAYELGGAIADVRQAARSLRTAMLAGGRASAWFALGYWHYRDPGPRLVRQTDTAIQEHMAWLAYEGSAQPADEAWVEWLLYAPVAELRRQSTTA